MTQQKVPELFSTQISVAPPTRRRFTFGNMGTGALFGFDDAIYMRVAKAAVKRAGDYHEDVNAVLVRPSPGSTSVAVGTLLAFHPECEVLPMVKVEITPA